MILSSFWPSYAPALLISLVLLAVGIVIMCVSEEKGILGVFFIAISLTLGVVSCSQVRKYEGRANIELCGINLTMNLEEARMMMHRFSEANHPNAVYSVGKDGNVFSIAFKDSTTNASMSIVFHANYSSCPAFFKSITYIDPNGINLGLLKAHDGKISDCVGEKAGTELTLNDTIIILKSR